VSAFWGIVPLLDMFTVNCALKEQPERSDHAALFRASIVNRHSNTATVSNLIYFGKSRAGDFRLRPPVRRLNQLPRPQQYGNHFVLLPVHLCLHPVRAEHHLMTSNLNES
jgi:hypothetical protein